MNLTWKIPDEINCSACENILTLTGQTAFSEVPCPKCGAPTVVPALLGKFPLLGQIGTTDTGDVYQAFDTEANRLLAIKVFRPEYLAQPEWFPALELAATAAGTLNHPHIAAVYGTGRVEDKAYLATELLKGGSLADRVQQSGKLPEKDAVELALKLAGALQEAHQRGLLHRNIRPGNILFDESGSPKLAEFGLPRPPGTEGSGREYQAPEKLLGQPDDILSEIFSLGATLIFALDGQPPSVTAGAHESPAGAKRLGLAPGPVRVVSHTAARKAFSRMHAWNPLERYPTWDIVIRELQQVRKQSDKPVSHHLPPPAASGSSPRPSKVPVGGIVAGLALVGLLMAGLMYWKEVKRFLEGGGLIDQQAAATASGVPDVMVNLSGTAAWESAWRQANNQFSNRQFQEAVGNYAAAQHVLGANQPVRKRWLQFFQALALMADERYVEARAYLEKLEPPVAPVPSIPASVTVTNFAETLLQGLSGKISTEQLRAAAGKIPVWAGGLATLVCAYKELERADYAAAALSFGTYGGLTGTQSFAWAFEFRALAQKQGRDCDNAARLLARLAELDKTGGLAQAADDLKTQLARNKIKALQVKFQVLLDQLPAAVAAAPAPEAVPGQPASADPVQAEVDALKARDQNAKARDQESKDRVAKQQASDEAGVKEKLAEAVKPFLEKYEFKEALAKCEELKGSLGMGGLQKPFDAEVARIRLLSGLKTQIIADIEMKQVSRSTFETRNKATVEGRLYKATDKELLFRSTSRETKTTWDDLPPDAVLKIAEGFASSLGMQDPMEKRVSRYQMLLAFCQQYGLTGEAKRIESRITKMSEKPVEKPEE